MPNKEKTYFSYIENFLYASVLQIHVLLMASTSKSVLQLVLQTTMQWQSIHTVSQISIVQFLTATHARYFVSVG